MILIVITLFQLGFLVSHYGLYSFLCHTPPSQRLMKIFRICPPIVWLITTWITKLLTEMLSNRTQLKYFLIPLNGAATHAPLNFIMDIRCTLNTTSSQKFVNRGVILQTIQILHPLTPKFNMLREVVFSDIGGIEDGSRNFGKADLVFKAGLFRYLTPP